MFDIGFWELSLILVVALLVVGPERLPKLARTAGLWLGRMRSMVQSVKSDIDRELAAEELKRTMSEQADSIGIHEIIEDAKGAIEDVSASVADLDKTLNESQQATEQEVAAIKSEAKSVTEPVIDK